MTDQQKSWFQRNWVWAVPVGCLTPILVCGGFFTLLMAVVFGAIKSSDAYTQSLAAVRANPAVVAAIGEPIEPGFLVTGNIQIVNDAGSANIAYTVSGPEGRGDVTVAATRSMGKWRFTVLHIDLAEDHRRINLLADSEEKESP